MNFRIAKKIVKMQNKLNYSPQQIKKAEIKFRKYQRKKFAKSVTKCHKITHTPKNFGSCMRKELKK